MTNFDKLEELGIKHRKVKMKVKFVTIKKWADKLWKLLTKK